MTKKNIKRKEVIELEDGKGIIVFMTDGHTRGLEFSNLDKSLDMAVKAMRKVCQEKSY